MEICPDDEHGRERPEMAPVDDNPESDCDQREGEYLRPQRPGRTGHDSSGSEQHESNTPRCRRHAGDHGPAGCDYRGAQCRQQRQSTGLVRGIEQDLRQPLMVRPVAAADRVGELVAQHDVMRVPHHLARTQLPPCSVWAGIRQAVSVRTRNRSAVENRSNVSGFARLARNADIGVVAGARPEPRRMTAVPAAACASGGSDGKDLPDRNYIDSFVTDRRMPKSGEWLAGYSSRRASTGLTEAARRAGT